MFDLHQYGTNGARACPERLRFTSSEDVIVVISQNEKSEPRHHHRQSRQIVVQAISQKVVEEALELKEVDEAIYNGVWFNSTNQHMFDPFLVEKEHIEEGKANANTNSDDSSRTIVRIDKQWWQSQPSKFQQKVESFLEDRKSRLRLDDDFTYPHIIPQEETVLDQGIYQLYCGQFVYEEFAHCIVDDENTKTDNRNNKTTSLKIIPLSEYDSEMLQNKARVCCLTGRNHLTDDDMEDFTPTLTNALKEYCQLHSDTGLFVKTTQKSAKNDVKLRPLYTPHDIMSQLTSSLDILGNIERDQYAKNRLFRNRREASSSSSAAAETSTTAALVQLVLMPWEPRITSKNEFRIFVEDYKVRAISQQRWYANVGLTCSEMLDVTKESIRLYEESIKPKLEKWPSMVLDVWVEMLSKADDPSLLLSKEGGFSSNDESHQETPPQPEEQEYYRCHLIEANPGGRWASSGSSLFEWRADSAILHRDENDQKILGDDVYVRFVQARV